MSSQARANFYFVFLLKNRYNILKVHEIANGKYLWAKTIRELVNGLVL